MKRTEPDPALKAAMEEIKPILKKYDCAAIVLLSSPGAMEYLYELSPSWSAAKLNDDGELRIRAVSSMYPTKEAHKKALEETTGMFFGLVDLLSKALRDMEAVTALLGKNFDISHWTRRLK